MCLVGSLGYFKILDVQKTVEKTMPLQKKKSAVFLGRLGALFQPSALIRILDLKVKKNGSFLLQK